MAGAATGSETVESVRDVHRMHEDWSGRTTGVDAVVRHARAQVPFYRRMPGDELGTFPIVDRATHSLRPDDFRAARPAGSRTLTSSGTSGSPLRVAVDDAAWYGVNYHFFAQIAQLAGIARDEFTTGHLGVLFVSNKAGRGSFVKPLPSLNSALYARLQLRAAGDIVRVYDRLRAKILYGKPTYLLDLRAALLGHGLGRPPWSPRLLLVSGEPLHSDDRARLADYFDAPVVDALASTEGGLIAAGTVHGEGYEVFSDNVRLEVRTDAGDVGESGTGELVLTNLLYRDTVFLRYRTGDHAELYTGSDGTQSLVRLWGREPEVVRLRTGALPSESITNRLGLLPGLRDFQLVSTAEPAVLRWAPDAAVDDPGTLPAALRAAVGELFPHEEITLEQCDRITPLGGKKRRYV
ncbi:hypothetical protein [Amycolatopsis cihanbeyliensis]|uniref:Phenylacetate-coenzyme A ligase PaaK-like adenylate-forming protein n=1 Tax=Amycolatopsis cihanbeyliensis TaxID=1128664 RepID=A0A542DDD3_AMYCI|nr:hypothetical protein [Amycolatopsis cihanbeyliensis]TQJ01075.1 phenylacetate-coenzyme A ligase PaaK-like adenylate-forming protein [Amycolatopsis cihanbeyliensis]